MTNLMLVVAESDDGENLDLVVEDETVERERELWREYWTPPDEDYEPDDEDHIAA